MISCVGDIATVLEKIAPPRLAEPWDNPGLQVGHMDWPVRKIMVSLDPTPKVITQAAERSADMLITHHPLLFKPIKSIDLSTSIGEIIAAAVRNTIAVYAAHTNFDSVVDGLNDALVSCMKLKNATVLAPWTNEAGDPDESGNGLGRIGDLTKRMDLASLSRTLKKALGLESVRMVGNPRKTISRVAICSGSGGGLLEMFFSSGADVFITGDIRYHEAREVEDRDAALIDIGHFGSEHIVVKQLGNRLREVLAGIHPDVEVIDCEVEKDPFVTV